MAHFLVAMRAKVGQVAPVSEAAGGSSLTNGQFTSIGQRIFVNKWGRTAKPVPLADSEHGFQSRFNRLAWVSLPSSLFGIGLRPMSHRLAADATFTPAVCFSLDLS